MAKISPTHVILGGHTGIGAALAGLLSSRGDEVHVASRRDGVHLTNEASITRYFDSLGSFDHLVVTAGSQAPGGPFANVSPIEAHEAFEVKFWGSINAARAAIRHLRPGGSITLTSGLLARKTAPGTYVKTAINAALEATIRVLAKELAPLRVNIVSPGLTRTEAYAGMPADAREQMFSQAARNLPVQRVGEAEDVARAYLLAIDNSFITGTVIDVNGGGLL